MRKIKNFSKVIIATFMVFASMQNVHAALFTKVVADKAGIQALLLQQIEQYKQDYELLQKNIQQLKQQTEQARLMMEAARKFSPEDLGGTVINEIFSASQELDSMLNDLSKAQSVLTDKKIGFGSAMFSLQDLAGLATGKRDWSDFVDVIKRAGEDELLKKCREWSEKLSQTERMYIWNTFHMSPEDYRKIQVTGEHAKDLTSGLLAQTDSSLKSVMDKREKYRKTYSEFLRKLLDGNQLSQVEAAQADAAMNTMNGSVLTDMLTVIQSATSRSIQLDAVKEAEQQAAAYNEQVEQSAWEADLAGSKVPKYWNDKSQMKGFSTEPRNGGGKK